MPDQNGADRFSERYAGMSDEEIKEIAADSADLTDKARVALRSEIAKRNLDARVVEAEPAAADIAEAQQWMLLRRFRDLPEALLAKGLLDSAGVESMLTDENMIRLDWFISNLLGNVKLNVKPEDVEAAEAILNEPIPEDFDYDESSQFEQPKCPKCGSLDITFETLNKPVAYGSAWLGFPLPIKSEKWICNACEARWVEEADPPSELGDTF